MTRDIRSDVGPDVGPDVGRDVGRDIGWDVGRDVGWDVGRCFPGRASRHKIDSPVRAWTHTDRPDGTSHEQVA